MSTQTRNQVSHAKIEWKSVRERASQGPPLQLHTGMRLPKRAAPLLFTSLMNLTTLRAMSEHGEGISKRQLGIALAILGAVGFLAVLSIDLVDFGRQGGIGPAQSLALLLTAALSLIGLSLIPLGDAPA